MAILVSQRVKVSDSPNSMDTVWCVLRNLVRRQLRQILEASPPKTNVDNHVSSKVQFQSQQVERRTSRSVSRYSRHQAGYDPNI